MYSRKDLPAGIHRKGGKEHDKSHAAIPLKTRPKRREELTRLENSRRGADPVPLRAGGLDLEPNCRGASGFRWGTYSTTGYTVPIAFQPRFGGKINSGK